MLKFSHLSVDPSLESLGEGREKAPKKKKAVSDSCTLSILLFSLPLSLSVTPSDLLLYPSLTFFLDLSRFFYLVTFVLSIIYSASEKAFKRQNDHRKQLKHKGNLMHNTQD